MRTFQHPSNGDHAVAAGDAAESLLDDGWLELDPADESETEPDAEADHETETEPDPETDPETEPETEPEQPATPIPAPEKPLAEMKLTELIAYAETIGVAADDVAALRKPGTSKAKAIETIDAHIAARSAE